MVKLVMYGMLETAWQEQLLQIQRQEPRAGVDCVVACHCRLLSLEPVFRFEPCYSIWLTTRWRDEYYFSTASFLNDRFREAES